MIVAEKVARAMGVSPREVYRRIEADDLHIFETSDLQVLVCLRSFSERSLNAYEKSIAADSE